MPYIMESQSKFHPDPKLKLMDQIKEVLRYHHYAYRTEQTYCQWILRYIRFFDKTHPQNLNSKNIDVVCFTGDIADWGLKEEYQNAQKRFDKILRTVNVPYHRFFRSHQER